MDFFWIFLVPYSSVYILKSNQRFLWNFFEDFGIFRKMNFRENFVPSTREVSRVTFAALRLPAGKAMPILSSLSLKFRPPSFDLALEN